MIFLTRWPRTSGMRNTLLAGVVRRSSSHNRHARFGLLLGASEKPPKLDGVVDRCGYAGLLFPAKPDYNSVCGGVERQCVRVIYDASVVDYEAVLDAAFSAAKPVLGPRHAPIVFAADEEAERAAAGLPGSATMAWAPPVRRRAGGQPLARMALRGGGKGRLRYAAPSPRRLHTPTPNDPPPRPARQPRRHAPPVPRRAGPDSETTKLALTATNATKQGPPPQNRLRAAAARGPFVPSAGRPGMGG